MLKILKRGKRQNGFTLIELMIVIAIIGILAAIAIPQFSTYRAKGYNATALCDIRNLKMELDTYFTEWNQYPH